MHRKWNKYVTPENVFYIVFFVSMAVLLYIGRYNFFSADDYAYGIKTHEKWRVSNSFFETLQVAISDVIYRYNTWQGAFSSAFMAELNPIVFSEKNACLVPFVILIPFMCAEFFFFNRVLKILNCDKKNFVLISLVMIWLFVEMIESPVEGIYWYNGAIHYMSMMTAMIVLFASLINVYSFKHPVLWTCISCVSAIYVGGGNYVTALFTAIVLVSVFVNIIVKAKKKSYFISVLLVYFASFMVNVLAPGNNVRKSVSEGLTPLESIIKSFGYSIYYARKWITPLVTIGIALVVVLICEILPKTKYKFRFPGFVIFFLFCIWTAMFTPLLYGIGNVECGRALNVIQNVFYIILVIECVYFCKWFSIKIDENKDRNQHWKDLKQIVDIQGRNVNVLKWVAVVLLILIFCFTGDKNTFSSMSALRSLTKGEAQCYYSEQVARLDDLYDNTKANVEFPPISVRPKVLYLIDIQEDDSVDYWINRNMAMYYGKESVRLISEDE